MKGGRRFRLSFSLPENEPRTNYELAANRGSRNVYFVQAALPLCIPQLLTWRYFPASPKFLYIVRADRERALKSVRFYHGSKAKPGAHE